MTTATVRPEASASFTVPEPVIDVPAHVIHHPEVSHSMPGFAGLYDFEDGSASYWHSDFDSSLTASTTKSHTGSYALRVEGDPGHGHTANTYTGYVDDAPAYMAIVWVYTDMSDLEVWFYDYELGHEVAGEYRVLEPGVWTQLTYTAERDDTGSFWIQVDAWAESGVPVFYIDDVRVIAPAYQVVEEEAWDEEVEATYTTTPTLTITEGKLTLADDWSPYAQAVFTVPKTRDDLLEQLDPRTSQRIIVTATEQVGGTELAMDLGIRERRVNHADQTLELEAMSDEALLIDRCNVSAAVDNTPRTYETSLRDIVSWALEKIDAELEPGDADADLTAAWPGTNLMPNPSGEVDTSGWVAGATGGTITRNSGGHTGSFAIRVSNSTAGYAGGPFFTTASSSGVRVTPGKAYTTTAWVRSNRSINVRLAYQWAPPTSSGAVSANALGPTVALTANTWTKLTMTATVPQNVDRFGPYVYPVGATYPASSWIDIDEVTVFDTFEDLTYFDGSKAADALYTYEWDETAHNSVSRRVPIVERPRELFGWKPGQSLWDFLQPLLNVAGLRLFCDVDRKWYLVDPENFEVPGYVLVQSGHNATEGEDIISRNDESWADAVVFTYKWTDRDGLSHTAYDFAGDEDGKCVPREVDSEYPGPGAAAALLNKLQGKGRTQEVTALTNYTTRPGMDISVVLPGTYTQNGKVREVIFDLKSGLMDVATRGLTEVLPGAWSSWDPEETWSDVDSGLLWKDA